MLNWNKKKYLNAFLGVAFFVSNEISKKIEDIAGHKKKNKMMMIIITSGVSKSWAVKRKLDNRSATYFFEERMKRERKLNKKSLNFCEKDKFSLH